jgi:hypothetical protein
MTLFPFLAIVSIISIVVIWVIKRTVINPLNLILTGIQLTLLGIFLVIVWGFTSEEYNLLFISSCFSSAIGLLLCLSGIFRRID